MNIIIISAQIWIFNGGFRVFTRNVYVSYCNSCNRTVYCRRIDLGSFWPRTYETHLIPCRARRVADHSWSDRSSGIIRRWEKMGPALYVVLRPTWQKTKHDTTRWPRAPFETIKLFIVSERTSSVVSVSRNENDTTCVVWICSCHLWRRPSGAIQVIKNQSTRCRCN